MSVTKKEISGIYNLTSSEKALYSSVDSSAIRIQFLKNENSITPFVSAKFCVITAEDVKILVGVFSDSLGVESTIIQIPLLGQSIADLVSSLNKYVDVFAESVNSFDYLSCSLLKDTAFTNASGSWVYFSAETFDINSSYSSLSLDIRYFLTSAEPVSSQNNLNQSLGGYVSTNEINRCASLLSSLSIYDKILYLDKPISSGFSITELQKNNYVQINDEIIKISKWSGNVGYIEERNVYETSLRCHPKGSVVREIVKNNFFDMKFGDNKKQYRCIAVKNINNKDVAKNMKVFFKINSRNNLSSTRLAIEIPNSDYYSGVSSSSGITSFSVNSLVGKYKDNHFLSSPIVFTSGLNSGQKRLVKSFNRSSGIIEIDERLPNNISSGDNFYIDTAPSSRIKSGTKTPIGNNISNFFSASSEQDAVSINVSGLRESGSDLKPGEVIYIWVERELLPSNDEFLDNRFSVSLIYSKV